MILSLWNVRGINNPHKQARVLKRASLNNVDILCLLETRVRADKAKDIFDSTLANWNVSSNYEHATNGRIWILWKKCLDLSIIHASDQTISTKGFFLGSLFFVTVVYGSNDAITRRHLWQHLYELDRIFGQHPWILGGDFNIILQPNESSNFEYCPHSSSDMKDFQNVTQDLFLHDHPYFGPLFTWSNKQILSYFARKLDRVLVNPSWAPTNHPKLFKFFNFWTLHPSFMDNVAQSWQIPTSGNPMQILFLKLKRLKSALKNLNNSYFSYISSRVKYKQIQLENQQLNSLNGIQAIEKNLTLQKELITLQETELLFLKQKAKVQWIREGDKSSKFFHPTVASKIKKDTIRVLIDEQGNRIDFFDAMSVEIISYFTNLIGSPDPNVKSSDPGFLKDIL
ncbi:uncharacterized protein LOC120140951 [Hibiscus syriacus]|uniref:uncharacterized protein LOC120140951 n=1 Tax=Hibiscus syriacus TaxID=106335 RepID=UPI001920F0C7|nr:uncharacterized protein LOC120140951 [Hibiscus syriacus]